MIDSHAHIYSEEFNQDIDEVIKSSSRNGISKILMPNIDVHSIEPMLELEKKYPEICYSMMGLHPCYVKEDFEKQLEEIGKWLTKKDFIAIGEIGTDLYWDKTYWELQKEAFHVQCRLALEYDLPIVIHCRESIDETIQMVSEYKGKGLKGVFHCFTGSVEQGRKIADLGSYLGLGGVSTFKNGGLDKVIPRLDRSRIILETDSPYLAPTPNRGKRNDPSMLRLISEKVAEFLQMSADELDILTTKNTLELFPRLKSIGN